MHLSTEEISVATKDIKSLLDLLSNLFNIRTAFLYGFTDDVYKNEISGRSGAFQPYCKLIQKELKHKCIACDQDKFKQVSGQKEPLLYRCYNGLYEMYLPVYLEALLVGYLHFGQVRSEEKFNQISSECNLDEHSQVKKLETIYNGMEVVPKEKLLLIAQLFKQFADQIMQNKLITIRKSRPEHFLKKYIEENLAEEISIENAAVYIGRSPSFITHQFKQHYKCTFHQYVINFRIEKAKDFLRTQSIEDTSQNCGFKNRYHFSRIFKQITGESPAQYKKSVI